MRSKVVSILAYMFSGAFALVLAVYFTSWVVKPGRTAVPNLLAQNTEVPAGPAEVPADQVSVSPVTADAGAFLEPYIYDTKEGRRNPFRPPSLIDPSTYSSVVMGPSTPLERFELDELRLTGVLWDVKNPKAMFIDPNKEVHVVSKDDRIGRRRGYVAVIREGEVVVVETTTFSGETVYSTRVLRIER